MHRPTDPLTYLRLAVTTLLPALLVSGSVACQIPVFRYALENWEPDRYRVMVVYRGALQPDEEQLVRKLESAALDEHRPLNMVVLQVEWNGGDNTNLDSQVGAYLQQLVEAEEALNESPQIAVFPSVDGDQPSLAWSGALTSENVTRLIDSPAREEVVRRLTGGESAVWVLIESGETTKDDAAEGVLRKELERQLEQIELPAKKVLETEVEFREDTSVELKLAFSIIRISRSDMREAPFVSLLLHSEPDLKDFDEPIALPIFGRGRTCFALVGEGIHADTIEDNCRFICGACSCQVKWQNPGRDMLLAANWEAQITGSAMPKSELPELIGISLEELAADTDDGGSSDKSDRSDHVAADSTQGPIGHTSEPPISNETVSASSTATDRAQRTMLVWVMGIIVVGAVVVFGASAWMKSRGKRE